MKIKAGTRIEVRGWGLDFAEFWEPAKIGRVFRHMLPMPAGYHPVTFADGRGLLIHESGFRVTDNRAA